ncbi:DNA polymerase III subunit beta, partial [Staphylococcus cohnii]
NKIKTMNERVKVSSTSPEIGTVKEDVKASNVDGGNLKISFNSKYMMDALKAIDNDEVEVEFFGTMKPFILKPKDDDSVTQLILPIRTY